MKRKMTCVALVCIVVLLISIGSVNAYMRKQTRVVENVFTPVEVSCEVVEIFENNSKTSIEIKNTGTMDAYLRLRFVTYWIDSNGDILFETSPILSVNYDTSKWIVQDDIYYYTEPVSPGSMTENLLQSEITLAQTTDGKRQVVEVFAEAIQNKPQNAVAGSWGVTIDSNGNITAAP